jgi:hypothetical protein
MGNFNSAEIHSYGPITGTTAPFTLRGGNYSARAHATTWNSATLALSRLAADGSTYVNVVTPLTADGYANVDLPGGTYRFTITGSPTGIYVDATSTVSSL